MRNGFFTLPILGFLCSGLFAEPEPAKAPADTIVERYVAVSQAQQGRLQGASMEVDIEADVPKLNRHGRLRALRKISRIGRITYDALRFEGDRSIKNEVIARYLTAESEARDSASLAITPANYKFRYRGLTRSPGRLAYVLQVSPKKKKVGLFSGELWVDAETYLPLREAGRFVKSPSIFLKKVEFVREYEIRDGVLIPRHLESSVQTRLVGMAHLSVAYTSVELSTEAVLSSDSQ
ncbi:MAG: hypothetical protein HYR60_12730 [Acidobacteria bacterium]|nr:hypothetical protein [Acidobacteriota bacterium]MBI3471052.1 hypothetical protein [Candidatus Solibacter usitatus]